MTDQSQRDSSRLAPCWRCHGFGSVQVTRTEGAECPTCKGTGCLPASSYAQPKETHDR
jgi:DnaJ-class molecular chaperone